MNEKKLKPGPVPMSENGTKTLWVRLPRDVADVIEKRAKTAKTSTSAIIRGIVQSELTR